MRKSKIQNLIRVTLALTVLLACVVTFCGCHVFAWYIPKQYTDEQMASIYDCLKSELGSLSHVIASVGYYQEGVGYYYNIFMDEGKLIIRYDVFDDNSELDTVTRGLYYDGTLKEWDVEQRTETVTSKDVACYDFLLERVREIADYFKTQVLDVMPYRDDSYCHECFPWGVGMAQMYYLPNDDNISVSASWTVETDEETGEFPSIFEAEYSYSNNGNSVSISTYKSAYGIDERITSIINNYEEDKERDIKMLYKQVYVKGLDDTLTIELYNNDATKALLNKLAEGDITITLDDYGDFEKVGSLGFSLPTSNEHITTDCGDVMLYQGNQMVIFYGQNTWDYTKIGFIAGYSESAFADVIRAGEGKIQLTLSLNRE